MQAVADRRRGDVRAARRARRRSRTGRAPLPLAVPRGHIVFDACPSPTIRAGRSCEDVSFEVPPGRTVAIVGPSGAGKSTLARLLFRFYDVDAGAIRIDGQDLRDVTQLSLRAGDRRGAAGHGAVQRHDLLQHRLWPARGDARRGRGRRRGAARSTTSSRALPDGYETQVGERGLKLSGGEKQRVAIARVDPQAARRADLRRGDAARSTAAPSRRSRPACARSRPSARRWSSPIAYRRSSTPTRSWCSTRGADRRARPPRRLARRGRRLCGDVAAPAPRGAAPNSPTSADDPKSIGE